MATSAPKTEGVDTSATGANPPESGLRIAMLAPPWLPVPPPAYGGIESVVALLCDGLVDAGHDVTLFAAPGSDSPARVFEVLPRPHPDEINSSLHEADHVSRVFDVVDAARHSTRPFDVVHDHCGFTPVAMAERLRVPLVHTLHGPFTEDTAEFYSRHSEKAFAVALSPSQRNDAPDGMRIAAVIPNPIRVEDWPCEPEKQDYVLWVGRMNEDKGPHRAIAAARKSGVPLVVAGPVQTGQQEFFDEHVAPEIDDDAVQYVGDVGGERKQQLFSCARALLMPIRWPEPFGMVMVEAMACGTPVIAFPEGAAQDIVVEGETGYLVDDEDAMAAAIGETDAIDPARCRAVATERYDVASVAEAYVSIYRQAIAAQPRR